MKRFSVNQLVIAALIVSAAFVPSCDKDGDETETDTITVSGTLTGEYASWDNVSASFDGGETWAITSPISNGKFSIELSVPDAKYLELLSEEDFPDEIITSDKSAKVVEASFYVRKGNESEWLSLYVVNISPTVRSSTEVLYWYVDKNVNITGEFEVTWEMEDTGEEITDVETWDMKLIKGWNTAVYIEAYEGNNNTFTIKTSAVPSNAVWMTESQYWEIYE